MAQKTNLAFCQNDQINIPFVEGAFLCNKGDLLGGYFIIDSGSVMNIFNKTALKLLDESCFSEHTHKISAIDNKGEDCVITNVEISLGGIKCTEEFCISENMNFEQMFGKKQIIGILGSGFLRKHELDLDFQNKCLRSPVDEKTDTAFSFIFPMEYGFRTYGIPIVGIIKDGREYLCVVDSGCNVSTIAQSAMEGGSDEFKKTEGESTIHCVAGSSDAEHASIQFCLLSLDENGNTKQIEVNDNFNVLLGREFLSVHPENTEIPPLHCFLSTKFMIDHKWILDYHRGYIYSR